MDGLGAVDGRTVNDDYAFWAVMAGLLALQWGILGLVVYLSFVFTWTLIGAALPILVLCLVTAWKVWKTMREQRKVCSE